MRTELALLIAVLALPGCAAAPVPSDAPAATATPAAAKPSVTPCPAPESIRRAGLCRHPADVRAFVDDRDLCQRLRDEPWPEGDSEDERARRRALVEGVSVACAGMDSRLSALKARYADDPSVTLLLSGFAERIDD